MSENVYQQQQQQQKSRTPKVIIIKFLVKNCKLSIHLFDGCTTVSHDHLQQSSFVTHTCSSREFIGCYLKLIFT